jgi:hypothetical protein
MPHRHLEEDGAVVGTVELQELRPSSREVLGYQLEMLQLWRCQPGQGLGCGHYLGVVPKIVEGMQDQVGLADS